MDEKIYTVVPCSEVKNVGKDIFMGQGVDYAYEFKALYKVSKKECALITIHIFGKLKAKLKEEIEACYKDKRELQIPLIIQEGTGYVAAPSTMQ